MHHFKDALKTAETAQLQNPYNASIYGVLIDAHVELVITKMQCLWQIKWYQCDRFKILFKSFLPGEIYGMPEESIKAMQMAVEAVRVVKKGAALQLAQLCIRYNKMDEGSSFSIKF